MSANVVTVTKFCYLPAQDLQRVTASVMDAQSASETQQNDTTTSVNCSTNNDQWCERGFFARR